MYTRPHPHFISLLLLAPLASALLSGCNPWNHMPHDGSTTIGATWSDDLIAASDGLYVHLPNAGELVRVLPDSTWESVDLNGASPSAMALGVDDQSVLVFAQWPICDTNDEDVEMLADCPDDDLSWGHELNLVKGGEVQSTVTVPSHFNALAFSPIDPEGAVAPVAVAYLDFDGSDFVVDGTANLTEVMFINLETGDTQSLSAGFAADNILFKEDASMAVVLSRSQAVVVDLTSDVYTKLATFNLTLDADQEVEPVGAAFTPGGEYLIISVKGSGDLYVLNLDNESINIIDLAAAPSAMAVDSQADMTALVYSTKAQVDIMDHGLFDVVTLELEEVCTAIVETDNGTMLLYNNQGNTHDVYRLDLESLDVVEYVVGNPVDSLQMAPDEAFAVAVLRPEWSASSGGDLDAYFDQMWGLSILDMSSSHNIDLVVEAEPVGLAFSGGDGEDVFALLLMDGLDYLTQVNVRDASVTTVDLEAPPTSIGTLPDGGFYITHDSPLGMVTFLDPVTGVQQTANGFAIADLFGEDTLPRTDSTDASEEN